MSEAKIIYDAALEKIRINRNLYDFDKKFALKVAKTAIDKLQDLWDRGKISEKTYKGFKLEILLEAIKTSEPESENTKKPLPYISPSPEFR